MSQHLCDTILRYLQNRMPDYPFDMTVDVDFVDELVEDFPNADILEEIKAFRWYHDNSPVSRVRCIRNAIRRWVVNGAKNRF